MSKNFIETQVDFLKNVKHKDLKQNQKLTLIGAFLIFVGSFLPVLQLGNESSSILNTSIALYKNGSYAYLNTFSAGFLIIITSLLIAYFALFPKNKFIAIANSVGFVLYLYAFLNIISFANSVNVEQQAVQSRIINAFYGTNIASTLSGLTKSYDINWLGWGVLLSGIAVVFYTVKSEILPVYNFIQAKFIKKNNSKSISTNSDKNTEIQDTKTGDVKVENSENVSAESKTSSTEKTEPEQTETSKNSSESKE